MPHALCSLKSTIRNPQSQIYNVQTEICDNHVNAVLHGLVFGHIQPGQEGG